MSEKKKKTEEYSNKKKGTWFQRYFRSVIRDWDTKVMVYVMIVVSAIALIAGTVAWFTYYPLISVQHLGMTTADSENLRVAINSKGADLEEIKSFAEDESIDKNNIVFSFHMPIYDNVEYYETTQYEVREETDDVTSEHTVNIEEKNQVQVNKLAPGVAGEVTMYLTSLNKQINQFRITPNVMLTYADGESDQMDETSWQIQVPAGSGNISEDERNMLQKLVQGHILFFKTRESHTDSEGNVTYTYSEQIFPDKSNQYEVGPLEDELVYNDTIHQGEEKKVTIYWCWPYEYNNIPQDTKKYIQTNNSLAGVKTFENSMFFYSEDAGLWNSLDSSATEEVKTQLYDYADIQIGQLVKSMRFHFRIEGYHKNTAQSRTVTTSSEPTTP